MRRDRLVLIAVILVGGALRFTGLDWSVDADGRFHRFHPDETTLLANADALGRDITEVKSAYGLLPVYLLYATGHASGLVLGFDAFDLSEPRAEKLSFLTARALSATLGTATILLVFLIGHRAGGARLALVASGLLALSPGHIQQSHYYTVDAPLAFWITLALYLTLHTPTSRRWVYAAVGLAIGVAGGHRFVAALLAVPYALAHLWTPSDRSVANVRDNLLARARRLVSLPSLGAAALAALVVILSMPTYFLDPEGFLDESDQRNLIPSLEVATGETLRLWNFYDFTTTPYLFYLTDLFPAALGTVACLFALGGLVAFVRRPNRALAVLLAWGVFYFLVTAGLHTKPIRYTTPVLPVLACLAAYAWMVGARGLGRPPATVAAALVLILPTAAHGFAVARVYTQENVRFEAARWIRTTLPRHGGAIGETGGFPTWWMTEGFYPRKNDPGSLFARARNHVLPSNVIDILDETLGIVDHYVLIPQNRAIPYTAVPDLFPTGADYYTRLRDGRLGYERVRRFSRPAELFGWVFDDESSDPTIVAFDRPHVEVYRRTADYDSLWAAWRSDVVADPSNPDGLILDGMARFREGRYDEALDIFERAVSRFPEFKLAKLCRVEAVYRTAGSETAQRAFAEIRPTRWDYAGLTLAGLPERGAEYTRIVQEGREPTDENLYLRQIAAKALINLGYRAHAAGEGDRAIEWYRKSLELSTAYARPYTGLGTLYLERGRFTESRDAFVEATRIRADIHDVWVGLSIAQARLGDVDASDRAIAEAIRLEPGNATYVPVYRDIADYLRSAGRPARAAEIEAHIARLTP